MARHRQQAEAGRPRAVALAVWVSLAVVPPTLAALSGCERRPAPGRDTIDLRGEVFGAGYHVAVVAAPGCDTPVEIGLVVDATFAEIDRSLSTYRPDSAISAINAAPAGQELALDAHLVAVLRTSLDVHQASEGAFDPTVKTIVEAWGFGGAIGQAPPAPADDVLAAAMARVGMTRVLDLCLDRARLTKQVEAVQLDVNAIAPGYAADVLSERLLALGCRDAMVEVGGEVRARGRNAAGRVFRIGVETPDGGDRDLHSTVDLADAGLATSGDYRQYREVAGRRVSHTIDPRTGRPIAHSLASVTVIAPSAALADAWATALTVLGPELGYAVAEARGLEVLMILRDGDGFSTKVSSALAARGRVREAGAR